MTPAARLDESPGAGPLPRFELADWGRRYGVVAGITGRGDGFNLGLLTEDPALAVTSRWRNLIAAFAPPFRTFAVGLQTHETRVAVHRDPPPGWLILDGVDGHATRIPGLLLTVTVADCVPIYLIHPPTRTVALLHAGWRGVAAGILETGISTVSHLSQGVPSDIAMHCGVAICGACYEVGSEVQTAVLGMPRPAGPLDLRAVLAARARVEGVTTISISGWCAAHDRDRFFSHRGSGGRDGRMLAYLGVPPA
jgi:YfiH family protein